MIPAAMEFERQTTRRLHAEHEATLDLLGRFEALLTGRGKAWPPAADPAARSLFAKVADELEREIARHFEFEERELFPRLEATGEGDIAAMLAEEHDVIRAVAAPLVPAARRAGRGELPATDLGAWQALRTAGLELCERLVGHVQKEEMALLPALEETLEDSVDRELLLAYATE